MSKDKVGYVFMAWAFFFALATPGINLPTLLMVFGTLFYLV